VAWRAVALAATLALAAVDYGLSISLAGRSRSIPARARWMQRQARRLLWALAIEPNYRGEFPKEGVLVSNHVSYLDILVFGARHPLVFISKEEVARWPVFGLLARLAGTLFIRRELRSDVLRIGQEMPEVVNAGVVLAFFPEGTSTSGAQILPFRASLMAPAVENRWPVTPAAVRYRLVPGEGRVEDQVAYWGNMTFGPHLLGLLSKRRIYADVQYGRSEHPGPDRRALANRLHGKVSGLLPDQLLLFPPDIRPPASLPLAHQ